MKLHLVLFASMVVLSQNVFAASVLNVSAQNQETCERAVEIYVDLIYGVDSQAKVAADAVQHDDDGVTVTSRQVFRVSYQDRWSDSERVKTIVAVGPDRADRCLLELP